MSVDIDISTEIVEEVKSAVACETPSCDDPATLKVPPPCGCYRFLCDPCYGSLLEGWERIAISATLMGLTELGCRQCGAPIPLTWHWPAERL